MTNEIKKFAKGSSQHSSKSASNNAVIYTRVSTKEQAITNQSLETQKKYCLEYSLKNNFNILGFFGGTYESAKSDERNEFNRMIKFVKNQKEDVSFIVVYSLDRFSRTGDNAIFISSELKKQGISIISVTQPIDVSTHSGILQQNIQFIFSKYDNDLRKEKCMAGMKEKLLRGEWIGCPPAGYSYDRTGGGKDQRLNINEKGQLIKKCFLLKAQHALSNTEIASTVSSAGLNINKKRLSQILRNPFYCGYIAHSLLEGQLTKGKHPPIVSETVFLRANEMLKNKNYGYKSLDKNLNIPLKNFVRCSDCDTPLTAYIVKKKKLYYYKCNKIGCKCNRSAKAMNEAFVALLKNYQIDQRFLDPLKEQLRITFNILTKSDKEDSKLLKQRLTELNDKLEKVEERFAYGEIDKQIFDKIAIKLKEQKGVLEKQLDNCHLKLSNPEKFIRYALEMCLNLSDLWLSGSYEAKLKLQELVFPEGLVYDKKIMNYRTGRTNIIVELISSTSIGYEGNKNGQTKNFFDLSASVPKVGIEPTHPKIHDFESCASTNSATLAWLR